jgi:hypothetical protein
MSIEIPRGVDLHRLVPGAALTPLDRRAIRNAWTPALAQALITPLMFGAAITFASTAALVAAAVVSLFALALLPAQVRGCRKLATHRILRADRYAVSGIAPYGEYRQWLASLPEPGRLWRALGAPTPGQRLHVLHALRSRP